LFTYQEQQNLSQQGRIKVTGGRNPISIKKENLTLVDELNPPLIDWSLWDGTDKATSDVLSIIKRTRIGDIDRCDEFVTKLTDVINHQKLPLPRMQYLANDMNFQTTLMSNVTNHVIYLFYFDQIGHHLLIELQNCKARIFQSHVRDTLRDESPIVLHLGYTAKEWINPTSKSTWSEDLKQLHSEIGGGREVNYLTFMNFMNNINDLQRFAKDITDSFHTILPPVLVESQLNWEKDYLANKQDKQCSLLGEWCDYLYHNISTCSMFIDGLGNVYIFSNDDYSHHPVFHITIPEKLATPFRTAMKKLHGTDPTSLNYIMLFRFRGWEKFGTMNDITGRVDAVGWALSAITIPHQ
jgi:hypothetical protein